MKVYKYSAKTGEFLGATMADPSPLEPGKFLVPANATEQEPPKAGVQEVAVFEAGIWALKPDFRGQEFYHKTNGSLVVLTAIGPIPDELAALPRPGELYTWGGAAWEFSPALAVAAIRAQRNGLLAACDWTQMPDAPLTAAQKATWAVYRKALRDFPETCDPMNPVWPARPA